MPRRLLLGIAVLLCAPLLWAGCSGPRAADSADDVAPEDAPAFTRQIAPFVVQDSSGAPLAHPFLGGFNVPRPQFVDIDADGDPDLFVQERTDQVIFFEYTGSANSPALTWRTDQFRSLAVGEWFRFADMDQDGDLDLLAEQPFSHLRYYRNDGTPQAPAFTLAADTLRDVTGAPLFSDRQNIPNVTDVDCNGQLDLFIGRLDGTVMRYEVAGYTDADVPRFELVTDRFEGIEIIGQVGTMRHGANTLTFADIDQDGDQDLFWGDYFESSLLLIENTGGACSQPVLRGEPVPYPPGDPVSTSGYNAPAFADWNQDGRLDLFVGVLGGAYNANTTLASNFHHYERGADGFRRQTERFLDAIDIGNESIPAVGDLDGDGTLDLLLANKIDPNATQTSRVYRFTNRGTASAPSFQMDGRLDLPDAYHYAPALGDLTGDGAADLLLGTWKGRVAYYRNGGDGTFERVDDALVELARGSNSTPALADIDDDGDLDLFVGASDGSLTFYRNTGSAQDPAFTREPGVAANVEVDSRSAPALADVDGDGDLDLLVGSKGNSVAFYRNTGSAQAPAFEVVDAPSLNAPPLAAPAIADVDGDGLAELLLGNVGGGVLYFAPHGSANQP